MELKADLSWLNAEIEILRLSLGMANTKANREIERELTKLRAWRKAKEQGI